MTDATFPSGSAPRPSGGIFSRNALYFALVANILPSIPYFALSVFVCPVRILPILLYFLLAVVGLYLNVFVLSFLAVVVAFVDVVLVVSGIFNLSPVLILDSVKYSASLDLFSFLGYAGFAGAVALSVALYVHLLVKNRQTFKRVSLYPAILSCFVIVGLDAYFNLSPQVLFASSLQENTEFSSAIKQAALDVPAPLDNEQDVLIVMMEGMGAFADPANQKVLWEIFETPAIGSAFTVSTGTSPYIGSTTSAESRELCGKWGDYTDYLTDPAYDCLPARYKQAGYETAAFHAFWGAFFDRTDWFPRIGFEKLNFQEQLKNDLNVPEGKTCGLTFKGLCDLDVADAVEAYLVQHDDKPKFAYWLTLNTHLPLEAGAATPRLGCETGGPFDDWTVCTMTEMWMDVLHRVKEIALNPSLQGTRILVVGDHHPPVWTRQGRKQFDAGKIAWLHLEPKAGARKQMMTAASPRLGN
ncbi:sulfatase-like hydrolase/transferase [Roseibium sp. SCP14]|uniref:sulfatase-like hydrolase/transferase n=1 Tax=Roseibium sp. SCP14 TaxID=3141375 RepID=UPI00333C87D6